MRESLIKYCFFSLFLFLFSCHNDNAKNVEEVAVTDSIVEDEEELEQKKEKFVVYEEDFDYRTLEEGDKLSPSFLSKLNSKYFQKLENLPTKLYPQGVEALYCAILDRENVLVCHKQNDTVYVIDRLPDSNVEFPIVSPQNISFVNDTITIVSEGNGIIYRDSYSLTDTEFKYCGLVVEDPNEETKGEIEE